MYLEDGLLYIHVEVGEVGLKKILLIRRPKFIIVGPGEDFPSFLSLLASESEAKKAAMATDPPYRPTIAALQREHGGGQPPLLGRSNRVFIRGEKMTISPLR